jgi:hypothetical protein
MWYGIELGQNLRDWLFLASLDCPRDMMPQQSMGTNGGKINFPSRTLA